MGEWILLPSAAGRQVQRHLGHRGAVVHHDFLLQRRARISWFYHRLGRGVPIERDLVLPVRVDVRGEVR